MKTKNRTNLSMLACVLLAWLPGLASADPGDAPHSKRPSPLFSVVSVSATTVPVGSSITVKLTARNSHGELLTAGGLDVLFTLPTPTGAGAGTFSDVEDNLDGTYSATFTGAIAGATAKIGATINGQLTVNSPLPAVLVTPAASISGKVVSAPVATNTSGSATSTTPTGTTGSGSTTTTSTGTSTTGSTSTTTTTTGGTGTSGTGSTGTTGGTTGSTAGTGSTGSTTTSGTTPASGTTGSTSSPAVATGYSQPIPPQDANGWTVIPALQSGRNIYVSSSVGKDANDGLTTNTPKATIAAGFSLLRNGTGDHLLLKCGDTWPTGIPHWMFNGGGASRTDPMVISSYGTPGGARPVLQTNFLSIGGNGVIDLTGGGGAPPAFAHIWIIGLDFYDIARDPSSAAYSATASPLLQDGAVGILEPTTDFLIEDCRMRFYANNIAVQSDGSTDIRIRRCQILDSWMADTSHSQGILIGNASDVLIEENVIDHNGWNANVPSGDATIFNHNAYTASCTNVTFRGNITSNASNYGLSMSDHGGVPYINAVVTGNLFLGDANCFVHGTDANYLVQNTSITGNVMTEIGGNPGGVPQSWGISLGSCSGTSVVGNYFINKPFAANGSEFLVGSTNEQSVIFTGNTVYQWAGEGVVSTALTPGGVVLAPNDIGSPAANYIDASRTVGTYDSTLGGPGSSADFITQARNQSKATWNANLTANAVVRYISVGFSLAWLGG